MSENNMNGFINENESSEINSGQINFKLKSEEEVLQEQASASDTSFHTGNTGSVNNTGYGSTQTGYSSTQTGYSSTQTGYGTAQTGYSSAQNSHTGQWTGAGTYGTAGYTYGQAANQHSTQAQQSAAYGTGAQNTQTAQTSQTAQTAQNARSTANTQSTGYVPPKKTSKPRKASGNGRKWGMTICMALVFGLVAGAVMFGVNSIGNHITQAGKVSSEAQKPAGVQEVDSRIPAGEVENAEPGASVDASTSSENLGSVEAVVKKCMPSVVTIGTVSVQEMMNIFGGSQQYEAQGAGTGVIVGQNDTELLIATNEHVVANADSLSVGFIDESSYEATIKGTDAQNDLAIVAVKLEDISDETMSQIAVVELGDSDALNLGEQVVVIGNSLGVGQTVTSGCVSAFGRELQVADENGLFISTDLIQTDASINSGNSGGALLNMKGELVGINEGKTAYTGGVTVDNVGYAIPISKAEPILRDLMALTTREKAEEGNEGYLGVTCKDITSDSDLVTVYGFPEGVCFLEVYAGGPAAEAGLQKGDVLTKFDGHQISSFSDLKRVMEYYPAGEQVELTILRQSEMNGEYEEVTRTVTLCDYTTLENIAKTTE